jgi:hypothetical protein
MSYIQIQLGGKLRGLKFNMFALEEYTKRIGIALNYAIKTNKNNAIEDVSLSQATLVYACVYSGLIGNYYAKEIDQDFTFEDVTDWVDAASNADLEAACNCLSETERYKEKLQSIKGAVEAIESEVDKKKVAKKATQKSGLKSIN